MKTKIAKLFIFLLCVALMFSIAACSERAGNVDDGTGGIVPPTDGDNKEKVVSVTNAEARNYIIKAVNNIDTTPVDDPEWFNIDFAVRFTFHNYEKSGEVYTDIPATTIDYNIVVKGAFNLKDNSASAVFIEIKDVYTNQVKVGVYYYDSTLYLDIGGNKYYTEQLNMSQLGGLLWKLLDSIGIDIVPFIGNALGGQLDLENSNIPGLISIAWGILFNKEANLTYTTDDKTQYINQYLNIDMIMGMIMEGRINLAGFIDIEISWEAFGLPDLDPLLRQVLGFGLQDIIDKEWPSMTFELSAITQKEPVKQADGTTKDDYVFNGLGIDITCVTGEYDVDIDVTPFKMSVGNTNTVQMDLAGYNFGSSGKDSVYEEGSLTNLELNLQLGVDSEEDEELTISSILGNMLGDLGAVGQIPLKISGGSHYVFDVKVAASIDLFDNANNKAQVTFKYNDADVFSLYLAPDLQLQQGSSVLYSTLYIDTSNLTSGGTQLIPQLKLPNLNITQLLAGTPELPGLLGDYMKYLDPYYANTTTATRPSNADGEEGGGLDIMALLNVLLTSDGAGGFKYLTFPTEESSIFSLHFDNDGINSLLGMFMEGASVGVHGIELSVDFDDPFDSVRLKLNVTEGLTVHAGIGGDNEDGTYSTGLSYFVEPDFEMEAIGIDADGNVSDPEAAEALRGEYKSMSGSLDYGATITGNFTIGSTGGSEIDLSAIVGAFVENVFLTLGIETSSALSVEYELQAGVNLLDFSQVGVILDLYLLEDGKRIYGYPFLSIYYSGNEDTLFINPQVNEEEDMVTQLHGKLPITKIVDGAIPKISVPDLGLKDVLSGLGLDLSGLEGILGGMNADFAFSLNADGTVDAGTDGNNILDIAAGALDGIVVNDGVLEVLINAEVLGVLLQLMNMDLTGDLPKVNGNLAVHLGTSVLRDPEGRPLYEQTVTDEEGNKTTYIFSINYDDEGDLVLRDENGNVVSNWPVDVSKAIPHLKDREYITAHLGILDSTGKEVEAFYIDLVLLDTITVKKGSDLTFAGGGHSSASYTSLTDWVASLVISVNVELELSVDASEAETVPDKLNQALGDMLEELLGTDAASGAFIDQLISSLAIKFKNNYFYENGLHVGIAVKGNIDINDLFASNIAVVVFDKTILDSNGFTANDNRTYAVIAGVYVEDGKGYIDLSYLGINPLAITDLEGTYVGAIALLWNSMYNDTSDLNIDSADNYQSKRDLMDFVMKETVFNYFFENFYIQNGYRNSYPETAYKYLLQDDGYIYLYYLTSFSNYFEYSNRSNDIYLKTEGRYYTVKDGVISIFNSNGDLFTSIEPFMLPDGPLRISVAQLEEEAREQRREEAESTGQEPPKEIDFTDLLESKAYSYYGDIVTKYAGIWQATITQPNLDGSVKALMDAGMAQTIAEIKNYEKAVIEYYDRTSLESTVATELILHIREEYTQYANATSVAIRNSEEFKELFPQWVEERIVSEVDKAYESRSVSEAELQAVTYFRLRTVKLFRDNLVIPGETETQAANVASMSALRDILTPALSAAYLPYEIAPSGAAIENPNRIALQIIYNSGKVSLELGNTVITGVLNMLGFGMVTEFITIDNIKLGVDTNNGLELDVTVGLDSVYTIGLGLNQLRASVDPDKRADYAVTVNKAPVIRCSPALSPPPRARAINTVPPIVIPKPILLIIKQIIEALPTAATPALPQ